MSVHRDTEADFQTIATLAKLRGCGFSKVSTGSAMPPGSLGRQYIDTIHVFNSVLRSSPCK